MEYSTNVARVLVSGDTVHSFEMTRRYALASDDNPNKPAGEHNAHPLPLCTRVISLREYEKPRDDGNDIH